MTKREDELLTTVGIEGIDDLPPSVDVAVVNYLKTIYDYDETIWCTKASIVSAVGGRVETIGSALNKLVSEGKVEERQHKSRKGYRVIN